MKRNLLLLALALLCAGAASAGTIYSDLNSFLGVTYPGYYLENFNTVNAFQTSMNFSGNGYAYTTYAPQGLYSGSWIGDGNLFGVSNYNDALTITFSSRNVTAIGGYYFVTDISNNVISGTVALNFADGTSTSITSGSPVTFLGYTSRVPLSSLVISGPGSGSWVSMDDFYVGARTPEPATVTLLGAGVLLLALLKRARGRVTSA